MDNLENYYKGDNAWETFTKVYDEIPKESRELINLFFELNYKFDLTLVIYGKLGSGSLNWINNKIPALNNLSPKECLNDDILERRLKVMLM